jgi:homoserine O-succinyltransferase/O-acetyltransferase
MPLTIEGGRVPPRWAERNGAGRSATFGSHASEAECVRIAFVNNMPDSALEDTEMQFFELIESASHEIPVRLSLYSLTGVPRAERGRQHLNEFYFPVEGLLNRRFDALIMTGTEPKQSELRNEPYWPSLTSVLDWAESNTASTILSCLAAHAGVLHSDGIKRHSLADKQFGVFDFAKTSAHPLTANIDSVRFPHSRWNEVRASDLAACGYSVLSNSNEGGVDTFIKKKGKSLFLHFQGHPEYSAQTLLKEYRRDIKRFLRNERETYPNMPKGYFDEQSAQLLTGFRDSAISARENERRDETQKKELEEKMMAGFPDSCVASALRKTWQSSAAGIYQNWLQYVASKKSEVPAFPAAAVYHPAPRKRSAVR